MLSNAQIEGSSCLHPPPNTLTWLREASCHSECEISPRAHQTAAPLVAAFAWGRCGQCAWVWAALPLRRRPFVAAGTGGGPAGTPWGCSCPQGEPARRGAGTGASGHCGAAPPRSAAVGRSSQGESHSAAQASLEIEGPVGCWLGWGMGSLLRKMGTGELVLRKMGTGVVPQIDQKVLETEAGQTQTGRMGSERLEGIENWEEEKMGC